MAIIGVGFQGTVQWILQHGYPLVFLLMLIEGPVVTAAAAFAAALRYLNIWIVLILSLIANIIPDALYYTIGYFGRKQVLEKYGHYIGVTPEKLSQIEGMAQEHSGKSLLAIKTIPLLATPGLIIVGASKMNIKKYAFWCLIITLPTSLGYLILGYYFGAAYSTVEHYLHIGTYVIIAAIAIIIGLVYVQRKYSDRIVKLFSKD